MTGIAALGLSKVCVERAESLVDQGSAVLKVTGIAALGLSKVCVERAESLVC